MKKKDIARKIEDTNGFTLGVLVNKSKAFLYYEMNTSLYSYLSRLNSPNESDTGVKFIKTQQDNY